jgi:heptosyltransferase-2
MNKILIIRFSSFGDIIQTISATRVLKNNFPDAEIHWITRQDFAGFLEAEPAVDKVICFDRKAGLRGLISLTRKLTSENYDFIYDAHNNQRSLVMKFIFKLNSRVPIVTRSKDRLKRLLFFKLRINTYKNWPFKGVVSFLKPLEKILHKPDKHLIMAESWHFPDKITHKVDTLLQDYTNTTVLVPSAAWPVKRWPVKHWQKLIKLQPDRKFVIIAGPDDDFTKEIAKAAPERVLNLTGQLSLLESACVIDRAAYVISGDTGFLHVADLFKKPSIALIGPTAFGYPYHECIQVLEANLHCQPCSKDGSNGCSQKIYQNCLLKVEPKRVSRVLDEYARA